MKRVIFQIWDNRGGKCMWYNEGQCERSNVRGLQACGAGIRKATMVDRSWDRKERLYGWCRPKESGIGALIRAVHTDLCGTMEKPSIETYEGGFLLPSGSTREVSITFLGWSHTCYTYKWDGAQSLSPPWWNDPCISVLGRGCSWYGAGCSVPSWCHALPQLTCQV
jgi:hypothetical protein